MALVATSQLCPCKQMILHRSLHLATCGGLAETERGHIQRVEREALAVCRVALRRAGAGVAGLLKIIDTGNPDHWLAGIERLHRFWDVEEHPVGEDAVGRIGVIDDQYKAGVTTFFPRKTTLRSHLRFGPSRSGKPDFFCAVFPALNRCLRQTRPRIL
jgi:hypothetical protein